jgi:DhnA family fructose-bisphosphate aldolase class Ia
MTIGKSLRLRRIFANGRALVVDCGPAAEDRVGTVRLLARSGADAVIVTPGLLDAVVEELGSLAVVLRIDGGEHRTQALVSVQAAMEMGADAVLFSLVVRRGGGDTIEEFGRLAEESRRLGMPVVAELGGDDWLEAARIGADYGADVVQTRFGPDRFSDLHFLRMTGRPFLATVPDENFRPRELLGLIYDLMQTAAQGIVLSHTALSDAARIEALHGLVHQGITVEEAVAIAGPAREWK